MAAPKIRAGSAAQPQGDLAPVEVLIHVLAAVAAEAPGTVWISGERDDGLRQLRRVAGFGHDTAVSRLHQVGALAP